jgi:uncharacterized protein YecE (DUF72 family)
LIPEETETFQAVLEPLVEVGKLSGLLAQFPYSFRYEPKNLEYIDQIADSYSNYNLAIEFRHRSWNRDDILAFFRGKKLIWVNIDQPVISQSLPLTAYVTHPQASYVRLHGRNYQNWFSNQGRDARYDYDYSMEDLNKISEKIKKLKDLAKRVFISGNNHYKGQAVKNLKELRAILSKT